MDCFAFNDAPQGDDSLDAPAPRRSIRERDQFVGSRRVDDQDAGAISARAFQLAQRAFKEMAGNALVIAADYHCQPGQGAAMSTSSGHARADWTLG